METERDTKKVRQRERSKQYRNLKWLMQLKNNIRISNPCRGWTLLSSQRRRQPGLCDRGRTGPHGCLAVARLDCFTLGSAHLPHLGLLRWPDLRFKSVLGLSFILKVEASESSYRLGSEGNCLAEKESANQAVFYWAFPTQDPQAGPASRAKVRKKSAQSGWGL